MAGGELWGGGGAVQVKHFECHFMRPPQEVQCVHMYSVCTCTVCLGLSLFYQSLFDSVLIMDFNNIATCLGVTFLYWGICKVTHILGVVQ